MISARVAGTGLMMVPNDITKIGGILKDQFLDLRGLSVYSSLSVSTLRDHIRSKGLPAFSVRGKILVKKSEFDKWVSQYRISRDLDIDSIVNDVIGQTSRRSQRPMNENH